MSASSEKLLKSPAALCNILKRIAIEAGEITLKHFDDAGYHDADVKGDGSPVTIADQEAETYIEAELKELLSDVVFVGEEASEEGRRPDLSGVDYFWLVDPLDGTKEFISGRGDYTVNIALIERGEPVIGVVYAPVHGELYAGYHMNGDAKVTRWLEDSDVEKDVCVRDMPKEGMTVMSSASHGSKERQDKFLEQFKVKKVTKRGSSLKIVSIAGGRADIYPRFGPTCEWDTAAAHAILRAAGGYLTDMEGKELRYGGADPKFLNPEFIASSFRWWDVESV